MQSPATGRRSKAQPVAWQQSGRLTAVGVTVEDLAGQGGVVPFPAVLQAAELAGVLSGVVLVEGPCSERHVA